MLRIIFLHHSTQASCRTFPFQQTTQKLTPNHSHHFPSRSTRRCCDVIASDVVRYYLLSSLANNSPHTHKHTRVGRLVFTICTFLSLPLHRTASAALLFFNNTSTWPPTPPTRKIRTVSFLSGYGCNFSIFFATQHRPELCERDHTGKRNPCTVPSAGQSNTDPRALGL